MRVHRVKKFNALDPDHQDDPMTLDRIVKKRYPNKIPLPVVA